MTQFELNGVQLQFHCKSEITEDILSTYQPIPQGNKGLGEMFLCKIAWMLKNGFDSAYSCIEDYMVDACMDLAWTEKGRKECNDYIRNHEYFGIINTIFSEKYPNCEFLIEEEL